MYNQIDGLHKKIFFEIYKSIYGSPSGMKKYRTPHQKTLQRFIERYEKIISFKEKELKEKREFLK